MQLDQHPQAGDSSASVIDLTTEPPTRNDRPRRDRAADCRNDAFDRSGSRRRSAR